MKNRREKKIKFSNDAYLIIFFFILNEPRREVLRTFSGKIAITRRFGRKIKGFIVESKLYT